MHVGACLSKNMKLHWDISFGWRTNTFLKCFILHRHLVSKHVTQTTVEMVFLRTGFILMSLMQVSEITFPFCVFVFLNKDYWIASLLTLTPNPLQLPEQSAESDCTPFPVILTHWLLLAWWTSLQDSLWHKTFTWNVHDMKMVTEIL